MRNRALLLPGPRGLQEALDRSINFRSTASNMRTEQNVLIIKLDRRVMALWGNLTLCDAHPFRLPSRFLFAGPFACFQQGPGRSVSILARFPDRQMGPLSSTCGPCGPCGPCRPSVALGRREGIARVSFLSDGQWVSIPFLNIYCPRSLAFG